MKVTKAGIKEGRITCCGRGCPQRDSTEYEGYAGALTEKRITENNNTDADRKEKRLLERILNRDNLKTAYKQVKRNKGTHGIDGMEVEHLLLYLKDNGDELIKSILHGKYRPNPVRRVEIPKDNGKMRTLGIPTAVDRVIQQAIAQELLPIFEPQFAETSYGFRPKRSAHDALRKCKEYANEGYTYVVDMDLEKFFDTVNQAIHFSRIILELLGYKLGNRHLRNRLSGGVRGRLLN